MSRGGEHPANRHRESSPEPVRGGGVWQCQASASGIQPRAEMREQIAGDEATLAGHGRRIAGCTVDAGGSGSQRGQPLREGGVISSAGAGAGTADRAVTAPGPAVRR